MVRLVRLCSAVALACAALVAQAQTLRVAAAADLQPVLPGIMKQFTAQTGIAAEASYKSSATLATAIINGAPFDVFLAADFSFPERVIAAGRAEETQPVAYARGALVLWSRDDSAFHNPSLASLMDPSLKSLAIANPQHAPYGRAAVGFLQSIGLYDHLRPRLVVAENIAQAAQYTDSGNAQLGLISLTSALTPNMQADGHYYVIPTSGYLPIMQGAVIVRDSPNLHAAQEFVDFLHSPPVAKQLAAGGLTPIG